MPKKLSFKKLSDDLSEVLGELTLLSNNLRFGILISLYSTDILKTGKHSQTFTELKNIFGIPNPNLTYHLELLKKGGLIFQKTFPEQDGRKTYYKVSQLGIDLLNSIKINEKEVKKIHKEIFK